MRAGDRLFAGLGASAAAVTVLFLGSAAAAPGDLDPSFGTGGIVETAIGSAASARSVALQSDGRIVVAGWSYPGGTFLARYMPNGTLDSSFGSGGFVTGTGSWIPRVALQPDGKILVTAYETFSVRRYRADGSLDTDFGVGGTASGPAGYSGAVALQLDGRILVVGSSSQQPGITIVRFLADGTLDQEFGASGVVHTLIDGASGHDIAVQPDGKIVVGGSMNNGDGRFALARYGQGGDLDPTFGSGGFVSEPVGGRYAGAQAIAIDASGRIVAAGNADGRVAVARYGPDGSVDRSFGTNGASTVGTGGLSGADGLALQLDGKIVVTGNGANVLAVLRLRPDGTLDPTFGEEGISRKAVGIYAGVSDLVIQPSGQIVAAGFVSHESETHVALARYRVSSPTAIQAEPLVVRYGSRTTVAGTAAQGQVGSRVEILARDCYAFAEHRAALTTQGAGGSWSAALTPRSRTSYRARLAGDRSEPVTVQVRPRISLRNGKGVTARLLFGHSLSGESVALQRLRSGAWVDLRQGELARIGRTREGVVSAVTFRALPSGRLRVMLRQPNPYACYATAVSRAITR
jgi:uncharacterized delta-60 repeat protein